MNIELNNRIVAIDDDCVNLILYFNRIGLKTEFSCCGHGKTNFSIMFTKEITDEQIEEFILKHSNDCKYTPLIGTFNKWLRKLDGKLRYNWRYSCPTIEFAQEDYIKFQEVK